MQNKLSFLGSEKCPKKKKKYFTTYLDIPLTVNGKDLEDRALQFYLRSDSRARRNAVYLVSYMVYPVKKS